MELLMSSQSDEDRANHEETTSSNGQATRCRRCCVSQTTEVDGQPSQRRRLSVYPQGRLGVTGVSSLSNLFFTNGGIQ